VAVPERLPMVVLLAVLLEEPEERAAQVLVVRPFQEQAAEAAVPMTLRDLPVIQQAQRGPESRVRWIAARGFPSTMSAIPE
jgi:hypothetical protein